MYRNSSFPSWEKLTATTGEAKYQNAIGQTNRPTSAQRPYLILVLLAFVFTDAFPPCFWCYCKNFAHYHFCRNSTIRMLAEQLDPNTDRSPVRGVVPCAESVNVGRAIRPRKFSFLLWFL